MPIRSLFTESAEQGGYDTTLLYLLVTLVLFGLGVLIGHAI
ncbi:MAG TPA: hypothetical protein VLV55_14500 [Rhizomicrobium sp.]|nr:hypothetical protein [Rhizomicrobium sp.]